MKDNVPQDALRTQVAAFATDEIAPAATAWSMGAAPAPEMFEKAAKIGLTRLEVPVERGGLGASFRQKAELFATLAAADFGFAMSLINTHNVALHLCNTAHPDQGAKHLPGILSGKMSACTALSEPHAGSDFPAITTRACETSDGWLMNGEKTWIVNGRHAGLAIVFAQTGAQGNSAGIASFLVDLTAKGVTRYPIDAPFSQTSIGTGGFTFVDVFLPKTALLMAPGTAFKSILTEINAARTYVAAMCNEMLQAALDQAMDYGQTRTSFGKPLVQYDSWKAPLEAAQIALTTSRDLTSHAIALVCANQPAQLAAAKAKVSATLTCQQHLPPMLHAMGAAGLRPEFCFSRHLAAAQIAGFTDGATSLLELNIARLEAAQNGQKG